MRITRALGTRKVERAGAVVALGVVVTAFAAACAPSEGSTAATHSSTAVFTSSDVPSPTSAHPAQPGTGQSNGEQGGTDTCGATPCGVPGSPVPVTLWDPCDISAADIAAQGFRPETRSALSGSGGVDDKNCRWQSASGATELTVAATRQTIDDFEASGKYVGFSSLTVGGRPASQFRAAQDGNKIGCYVGVVVPFGVVAFVTRNLQPDAEEPCAGARRISGALAGYLH
ncbi:DUF3558 family protein [Nocardia sp. NPDC003482]